MSEFEFRPLVADDMEQFIDLRSASYGPVSDREQAARVLTTRLPYSLGAFKDGRLRCVSVMLPLSSYLGGRQVTFGGLSGVATSPESRRGGLVAQSLRRWFAELRERRLGWSAEHPFEPTFYAKLGYQTILNGHTVEIPHADLRASAGPQRFEELEAEPLKVDSAPRLAEIYQRFAPRFSFMLTRDDGVKDHWESSFQRPWEATPRFAFAMEDAYVIYTTEDDPEQPGRSKMEVRDFAYTTPAGRERLFALLARFEGQITTVRLHLPPGDSVALDRVAYCSAQAPELQVRIVDLASALEVLRWPQESRIVLRVVDADCPWNDGTFEIITGPEGAAVSPATSPTPHATLGIAALAALVTGAATAETLVADGRAQGSVDELRPLAAALSAYPVFKPENDHF